MRKKTREQESLDLAKIWMKKSIDPNSHGYDHAVKVESNALKIFDEYRKRKFPDIESVDENMIKLAVWWHDCFKAQSPNGYIRYYFIEGEKSAAIFEEQNKELIIDERRAKIYQAIWEHNKIWIYRIFFWKRPMLVRIIQEADSVECVHTSRFKRSLKKKRIFIVRIFNILLFPFLIVYLFLTPMSKAARAFYWENLKT